MTTLPLTDMVLRTAKPSATQYTLHDTLLPGFGLRVGATTKTFVVVLDRSSRRRITLGRYPAMKLQEARNEARRLKLSHAVARQSSGILITPFPKALETFIETYLPRNRASTAKERQRILRKHCLPRWRNRLVSDITRDDVNRITDSLLDTPVMANNAYACMRLFFRWSVRRGYADRSACDALQPPTKRVSRERVLSPDEHRRVAETAFSAPYPFGPLVALCLLTGQRRGELAQLRSSWIDEKEPDHHLPGACDQERATARQSPMVTWLPRFLRICPDLANCSFPHAGTQTKPSAGGRSAKLQSTSSYPLTRGRSMTCGAPTAPSKHSSTHLHTLPSGF